MRASNLLSRTSAFRITRSITANSRQANTFAQINSGYSLYHQNHTNNGTNTIRVRSMSTSPIYTVEYLSNKIRKELQAEHIDMEDLSNCGCGMKFDAMIVSPQFDGKTILQRQRLVNQTLADEMKHIHAFTMRTLTPSQWRESQSKMKQDIA